MNPQDNVAVIALVVSLIALVIALGQLAQQLFGTAEGYRRCAEPVIGEWHRLRWRKFIWSELRYETHFVTPRFVRRAAEDFTDVSRGLICFKNVKEDLRPTRNLWTWFPRNRRKFAIAEAPAVLSASVRPRADDIYFGDVPHTTDQETPKFGPGHVIVNIATDNEKNTKESSTQNPRNVDGRRSTLFKRENQASWLLMLPRMHSLYKWYQHGKQPSSTYQTGQSSYVRATAPTLRSDVDNTARIEGGIQFEEWVWDAMPADVSKPLATTTLGTLITLSVRLGMQWRTLSGVRSDQLLCEGEGYAITFTEIPSVGLVAKFRDTERRKRGPLPQLTPGRATEKLLFGIIPGAKYLVDQDIWCVADDRKAHVMREVCKRISRDENLYLLRDKKRYWETKNEVITFLCEFLPVTGSQCITHYFWGWDRSRQSVLKFYEGRLALWRHLKRFEDSGQLQDDTLEAVCRHLTHLRETYPEAAFGHVDTLVAAAAGTKSGDRLQVQANMIHDCRSIFRWTTDWFVQHGFSACDPRDEGSYPRTLYMHLVAAHLWMASHCLDEAKKLTRENKKMKNWNDIKHDHYDLDDKRYGIPVPYTYFDQHLYNVAETYIKFLTHKEHGVTRYMRDKDLGLSDQVVEVAWWVMILRGIVWTLPTIEARRGDAIPSSYVNLGADNQVTANA